MNAKVRREEERIRASLERHRETREQVNHGLKKSLIAGETLRIQKADRVLEALARKE